MPASAIDFTPASYDGPDFGWSLFQLIVQNVDNRVGARAGDLVATLAFLTGRVVQRATFREDPGSFNVELSGNGVAFLRNDAVSGKLGALQPGTLASTLVEAALVAGARHFPNFALVQLEAHDAMQRRGGVALRNVDLSASPRELVAHVQDDIDGLLSDPFNRVALVRASIQACGHAVGYQRTRFCPADAAELALSIALYGGWIDQRESTRR